MYGRRQDSEPVVKEEYNQKADYCNGAELNRCSNLVTYHRLAFVSTVLEEGDSHNPSRHIDSWLLNISCRH